MFALLEFFLIGCLQFIAVEAWHWVLLWLLDGAEFERIGFYWGSASFRLHAIINLTIHINLIMASWIYLVLLSLCQEHSCTSRSTCWQSRRAWLCPSVIGSRHLIISFQRFGCRSLFSCLLMGVHRVRVLWRAFQMVFNLLLWPWRIWFCWCIVRGQRGIGRVMTHSDWCHWSSIRLLGLDRQCIA